MRQHSPNSFFDNSFGQTCLQFGKSFCFHAARSSRVAAIDFLAAFFASNSDFFGIDDNYEIAGIHRRSVSRFVFSSEVHGNFSCQTAEPLVGGWLVRADTPGIRIEESWDRLGLRASASHDVVFEDVLVPFDQALEPRPVGKQPPYSAAFANWSAVLTSAIYNAVARKRAIGWSAG